MRNLLSASLGVAGQVHKRRLVFKVGRTRIHVDDVAGLGAYQEIEVVLDESESSDSVIVTATSLTARLGSEADQLVADAYVDLLTAERRTANIGLQ